MAASQTRHAPLTDLVLTSSFVLAGSCAIVYEIGLLLACPENFQAGQSHLGKTAATGNRHYSQAPDIIALNYCISATVWLPDENPVVVAAYGTFLLHVPDVVAALADEEPTISAQASRIIRIVTGFGGTGGCALDIELIASRRAGWIRLALRLKPKPLLPYQAVCVIALATATTATTQQNGNAQSRLSVGFVIGTRLFPLGQANFCCWSRLPGRSCINKKFCP
jgi:hypothetical protein